MSNEATQKATAATSEAIDKVFQEAMRSYEKALKSGIQLQEESVNLWKDLLTKLGSPEEFQAKLESMTADAFPKARKRMEEFVEAFTRPPRCPMRSAACRIWSKARWPPYGSMFAAPLIRMLKSSLRGRNSRIVSARR
jgi:hypothetical protein